MGLGGHGENLSFHSNMDFEQRNIVTSVTLQVVTHGCSTCSVSNRYATYKKLRIWYKQATVLTEKSVNVYNIIN